jgi:ADP-heptose:LPS heptosyltransferase
MSEIALKGASGLGDAIYAYPIVKYFASKYDDVYFMSDFPELFEDIPNVKCSKHLKINYIAIPNEESIRKRPIDVKFTYGPRKHIPGTSQYQDMCIFAKKSYKDIPDLPLKIDWEIHNAELINTVKLVAKGRKICVVAAPYQPFGREDKWGDEIKIQPESIQYIIDDLKQLGYLCIAIGNKFCLYEPMVEYNLINQTSLTDLMDLMFICDLAVTQIGNLLPISEALNKKNITIFSSNIPNCTHSFLKAITPEKCVHYKNLNLSLYDDKLDLNKVHEFIK